MRACMILVLACMWRVRSSSEVPVRVKLKIFREVPTFEAMDLSAAKTTGRMYFCASARFLVLMSVSSSPSALFMHQSITESFRCTCICHADICRAVF